MDERSRVESFYDAGYYRNYFAGDGAFSAIANLHYFAPFVRRDMTVVDFGCAGGWILAKLDCAERIGIEISPVARDYARRSFDIEMHESFADVAGERADLVISSHALEHTLDPAHHVREAFRVLKRGGLAVFVVPSETILTSFSEKDRDRHLYTWSPANLGNLFRACGFAVVESKPLIFRWPPRSRFVQKLVGWRGFHAASRLWGFLYWPMMQSRVVARKPDASAAEMPGPRQP